MLLKIICIIIFGMKHLDENQHWLIKHSDNFGDESSFVVKCLAIKTHGQIKWTKHETPAKYFCLRVRYSYCIIYKSNEGKYNFHLCLPSRIGHLKPVGPSYCCYYY